MPCYRLFCLARPGLALQEQAAVIRSAATAVLDGGGVLMDLQSYGEKPLAYPVRPAGQRFDEALMWQLYFHSHPRALQQLYHGLKVDERVIRHILSKHSIREPKPSTAKVAKWATSILDREYADKLQTAEDAGEPLWWDHIQPERQPLAPLAPLSELFPEDDAEDEADDSAPDGTSLASDPEAHTAAAAAQDDNPARP